MVKARTCHRRILIAVLLIRGGAECAHAAPDEELLGKDLGYTVGTPKTWLSDERVQVGSFGHLDSILPYRRLLRADSPTWESAGAARGGPR